MNKQSVVAHFSNNRAEIGRQLGLTRAAVSAWPDPIPERYALLLDRLTNGKLQYEPAVYQRKEIENVHGPEEAA